MYGYIYMTTNLINNKKYIGKHKSNKFDENYKGSGVALWRAIKKYGPDNFHTEIVDRCYSEEDINNKEKYWINKFNAIESREFYNMKDGGKGGFPPHAGTKHPLYGRRGKDSPNYGKKHKGHGRTPSISESKIGRHWYNDGKMNYFIYDNEVTENLSKGMLPKNYYRSDKLRKNQSEKISGRICINNSIVERRVNPDELNKYLSNGYVRGRLSRKSNGHRTDS